MLIDFWSFVTRLGEGSVVKKRYYIGLNNFVSTGFDSQDSWTYGEGKEEIYKFYSENILC